MLVHICCSVDSHYFLQRLRDDYPQEKIVGYFYNPNIHPQSEHDLRLIDVQRSCELLGIELLDESFLYEHWYTRTHKLSEEPEKGKRCEICFDERLDQTAKKALELRISSFTTTLLTSPKKSLEKIQQEGNSIADKYDLEFIHVDYRKGGGTQKQFQLAKEDQLYKQNYCGCFFALNQQREIQNIPAEELFSPVSQQIQPGSIESRMEIYTKRLELEKQSIPYRIIKNTVQAYRLLSGQVLESSSSLPSYILPYSVLKKSAKTKIAFEKEGIHYTKKENIIILDIITYNRFSDTSYASVKELYFNAPEIESDLNLRLNLTGTHYSTSPIIILDQINLDATYTLSLESLLYNTHHETLITF